MSACPFSTPLFESHGEEARFEGTVSYATRYVTCSRPELHSGFHVVIMPDGSERVFPNASVQ